MPERGGITPKQQLLNYLNGMLQFYAGNELTVNPTSDNGFYEICAQDDSAATLYRHAPRINGSGNSFAFDMFAVMGEFIYVSDSNPQAAGENSISVRILNPVLALHSIKLNDMGNFQRFNELALAV